MENSPVDEIKSRLDILEVVKEYVKLQKSGINYRGLCPFHSEKTPSFFVSPTRQTWHCFGACSKGGDIFRFIMEIEGVEFGDALRILAAKAGVELKKRSIQSDQWRTEKQRIYEICEWSARFFEKCLETETGRKVEQYLLERGINKESVKEWRIGYSPNNWDSLINFLEKKKYTQQEVNKAGLVVQKEGTSRYYDRFRGRIMFPIFDFNHQVVGFGGRIFGSDKEAKYLNTPNTLIYDKSKTLYGLNKARSEIRKKDSCILVEGYTDVIMSSQAEVNNVVSTSGTALTSLQLDILKRYTDNLITAFDMDTAGDSATKRGIDLAQEKEFNIKVALMPEKLDPADLIKKDPDKWKEITDKAVSIIAFYFETAFSQFDSSLPENKKKIALMVLPVIKKISSEIEKDFWIQELAQKLKVSQESIIKELEKVKQEISFLDKEEKKVVVRNRKNLLEEKVMTLLVNNPKVAQGKDFSFLSQENCQLIDFACDQKKDCSEEIKAKMEYFCLKAEIESNSDEAEKEINSCLSEIKIMSIKEKLNQISEQMKEAESKNDKDQLKELSKEFNLYCQKLAETKHGD